MSLRTPQSPLPEDNKDDSQERGPRRQPPRLQRQSSVTMEEPHRYKTELCRSFLELGICNYGTTCQFAHGSLELRELNRHPKYKTELCRSYNISGFCQYGYRCHFVHNLTELRDQDGNPLLRQSFSCSELTSNSSSRSLSSLSLDSRSIASSSSPSSPATPMNSMTNPFGSPVSVPLPPNHVRFPPPAIPPPAIPPHPSVLPRFVYFNPCSPQNTSRAVMLPMGGFNTWVPQTQTMMAVSMSTQSLAVQRPPPPPPPPRAPRVVIAIPQNPYPTEYTDLEHLY